MKKKYIFGLVAAILLVALFLIIAKEFPKNISRLPFFFVLILLDLYLWIYVRTRINKKFKTKLFRSCVPPKKINGFCIVRVEIATAAYGSFAMTSLGHFLSHTRLFVQEKNPW